MVSNGTVDSYDDLFTDNNLRYAEGRFCGDSAVEELVSPRRTPFLHLYGILPYHRVERIPNISLINPWA